MIIKKQIKEYKIDYEKIEGKYYFIKCINNKKQYHNTLCKSKIELFSYIQDLKINKKLGKIKFKEEK